MFRSRTQSQVFLPTGCDSETSPAGHREKPIPACPILPQLWADSPRTLLSRCKARHLNFARHRYVENCWEKGLGHNDMLKVVIMTLATF